MSFACTGEKQRCEIQSDHGGQAGSMLLDTQRCIRRMNAESHSDLLFITELTNIMDKMQTAP